MSDQWIGFDFMDRKTPIIVILISIVLLVAISGCDGKKDGNGDTIPDAEWAAAKAEALKGIFLSDGWGNPQLLPAPVNSDGWEDGAYITSDGSKIYFAYFQGNLIGFILNGVKDFEKYKRGPSRGVNPPGTIDVFVSEKNGSSWGEPKKFQYDEDVWSEGGVVISDGDIYYMSNNSQKGGFGDDDIYMNGTNVGDGVNSEKRDNDPHVIGDEMLFWRNDGSFGGNDIFISKRADGKWQKAVILPSPINSGGNDMQPFLTSDGTLYFTSDREGSLIIYKSRRIGENEWGEPEKIASGSGLAMGVGEPTLTADGKNLYFVAIFRNDKGTMDVDIAFATKK